MSETFVHHGAMFSYYSAKTRAYLSYKQIPFVEGYDVPVLTGRIKEATGKVMVPVVETPEGELLQDTTVIIDALEKRFTAQPILPSDPVLLMITRMVEFFIDELWICTAMNSRWNDPVSTAFAIGEFGRCFSAGQNLDDAEIQVIGERLAGRMQAYLPRLGVSEPTGQSAVKELFQQASLALNKVVGASKFAFGNRPCLIDFCLYAGYYAHQYRDPGAASSFLKSNTPELCYFIDNLHAAQCLPVDGDLMVSDSLIDYLRLIGPVSVAFAAGTFETMNDYIRKNGTIPLNSESLASDAALDPVKLVFNGQQFIKVSSAYTAWKLQRVLEVFDGMSSSDRARALQLAEKIGWDSVLQMSPEFGLKREGYQIKLV